MPVEDFIDLCKAKLRLYLSQGTVPDEYDIYVLWKDFWTVGSTQDNIKDLNNQKCVLGTSIAGAGYYEFTYVGLEEKLYLEVFTNTDSEEYDLSQNV